MYGINTNQTPILQSERARCLFPSHVLASVQTDVLLQKHSYMHAMALTSDVCTKSLHSEIAAVEPQLCVCLNWFFLIFTKRNENWSLWFLISSIPIIRYLTNIHVRQCRRFERPTSGIHMIVFAIKSSVCLPICVWVRSTHVVIAYVTHFMERRMWSIRDLIQCLNWVWFTDVLQRISYVGFQLRPRGREACECLKTSSWDDFDCGSSIITSIR